MARKTLGWQRQSNGREVAMFQFEATIYRNEYEALKKRAKVLGITIDEMLMGTWRLGIGEMMTSINPETGEEE